MNKISIIVLKHYVSRWFVTQQKITKTIIKTICGQEYNDIFDTDQNTRTVRNNVKGTCIFSTMLFKARHYLAQYLPHNNYNKNSFNLPENHMIKQPELVMLYSWPE